MVFGRLKDLNLELGDSEIRSLTERFINDANGIQAEGWDPYYLPDRQLQPAECVNLWIRPECD